MAGHLRIFACAVSLCACGSDPADDGGTEGTSSMSTASSDPSTSTTASTTATTTTASTSASTSASTDTTATTSEPTTSGTTDDPSGTSTDPGTSTSPPLDTSSESGDEDAVYRAVAIIGGLNRVRVMKRDDDADTCTYVSLVDPAFQGGVFGDVDVTEPWGVEFAGITDNADACDSDNPAMFGGNAATYGTGTVDLENVGMSGVPCSVDIDLSLTFDDAIPALPDMDTMTAGSIPVQGC